jgi:trans-2,3-dihydro-3-hydroxyanthranilate isomerase
MTLRLVPNRQSALRLRYHTLDVFTEVRFGGNPLAVVMGADDLDSDRMQAIAREFNLSETVFVLKPVNPAHTAKVRIFTPRAELPFAGHPTVGTAALLAEHRVGALGGSQTAIIALEETVGTVRVGVRLKPGEPAFAEFDAPRLPENMGSVPSIEDIAGAIGLIPSEIGFENHRPTCYSAGLPYTYVPVRTLDAIGQARPALGRWERAFGKYGAAYLYCRETMQKTSQFHARMFDPDHGIIEDAATGSAAAAFAAVMRQFDEPPPGEHRVLIEQGLEMGRPSYIHLSMVVDTERLVTVRIGGHSVRIADGEITV